MPRTILKPLFAATLFALQAPAYALTLNTDARYVVDETSSGGFVNTDDDPKTASSGGITSYVEWDPYGGGTTGGITASAVAADGRNSARGSADDQGNLAVRAGWEAANSSLNTFTAEAKSSQTYTNNSGGTLDYSFDFTIPSGMLQVWDAAHVDENSGLYAKYSIAILLNGGSIWSSAAILEGGRDSHTLTETGTDDIGGDYFFDGSYTLGYEFGPFSKTLSLISLADGQSFTLDYQMLVEAGGPGYELGSLARFGDPNNVNSSPGLSGQVTAQGGGGQIPEPATLALLGLGLLGLAAIRRNY